MARTTLLECDDRQYHEHHSPPITISYGGTPATGETSWYYPQPYRDLACRLTGTARRGPARARRAPRGPRAPPPASGPSSRGRRGSPPVPISYEGQRAPRKPPAAAVRTGTRPGRA